MANNSDPVAAPQRAADDVTLPITRMKPALFHRFSPRVRRGLLWVTMALAELTTAQELADQAEVLRAATEFDRRVREDTATFDGGKMSYAVTVNYRTNSGCNSRRVVVEATSTDEALDLAHEIVRRRRGVIRIDGGTIDGRPLPVK